MLRVVVRLRYPTGLNVEIRIVHSMMYTLTRIVFSSQNRYDTKIKDISHSSASYAQTSVFSTKTSFHSFLSLMRVVVLRIGSSCLVVYEYAIKVQGAPSFRALNCNSMYRCQSCTSSKHEHSAFWSNRQRCLITAKQTVRQNFLVFACWILQPKICSGLDLRAQPRCSSWHCPISCVIYYEGR